MRVWRSVVALAALALLAIVPTADATHLQQPYAAWVAWAGCRAEVITDDAHSVLDSFYDTESERLYLGTLADEVPEGLGLVVVFHEVTHCLQGQHGDLDGSYDTVQIELDADRGAANLLCALGKDGARLEHDLFLWARDNFGYNGDSWHGTLAERIAAGYSAPNCKRASQSP